MSRALRTVCLTLAAALALATAAPPARACPFCLPTSFWKAEGRGRARAGPPDSGVLHLAVSLAAPAVFAVALLRRCRR